MRWASLFGLLLMAAYVSAQVADTKNFCTSAESCSKCLLKGGDCYWCTNKDFKYNRTRCNTKPNLEAQGCTEFGMDTGKKFNTENTDFNDQIQVKPQKIKLELRPDEVQQFTIQVQPAPNYPVELYYLMDLSKSMEDDLNKLKTLGTSIAQEISNITKNYRLAFGSFVDKTVSPFVEDDDPNFKPCKLQNDVDTCEPTFGFRHVFDFSKDANLFETAVAKQTISGNLDTPEGGFDGLMQVAVCEKEIGWKDKRAARKIVVFVTDATPHIAGDGKIGGIITPNDGKCYLQAQGNVKVYTKTKTMDYPSIGLLKAKLKENKVIPIFAVTKDVSDVYKQISGEWAADLGAVTGVLEGDSSNIVKLIRDNYAAISTTVKLNDNSSPDITVSYRVQGDKNKPNACPNVKAPNECADVTIKEGKDATPVDFEVYVTANDKNCENPEKRNQSFTITIPGFGDTIVDIEMICNCDCEATKKPNAPECNSNGTYVCASCECNKGRYGDTCQCDGDEQKDFSSCKHNNVTDKICSDFGRCVCGVCICNIREDPKEIIDGLFCECNNFNCPRHQNIPCGGEERGYCKCGSCICKDGYHGENCGKVNCTIGAQKCRDKDGLVCSGHGSCECDRCLCDKGYDGKQCETCVSCPGKCTDHKECVLCQVWDEGDPDVCAKCNLNIITVNKTTEQCVVPIDENCFIIFRFEIDEFTKNETLYVQREKRCIVIVKKEPPILAIIFGVIGGIVLLGLILLLLWKLLITAYDNYEYHKFEKDRMKSKWENDENPIYRPSKQQFQNPAYAGNK